MMLYEKIFRTLRHHKVNYLVVGGVATAMHGAPRFTKDLDIMVDMSPSNLKRMLQAFEVIEYLPRLPVNPQDFIDENKRNRWVREKNMKAFTFVENRPPFEQVDIVFESPVCYQEAKKRRK
ncbi:MAG: hypothetical protein HY586_06720, partial [Candidatus Omnitrophica bacterium]|nr:hypothetical protein [Candidatus Omnitrophota bacterium]